MKMITFIRARLRPKLAAGNSMQVFHMGGRACVNRKLGSEARVKSHSQELNPSTSMCDVNILTTRLNAYSFLFCLKISNILFRHFLRISISAHASLICSVIRVRTYSIEAHKYTTLFLKIPGLITATISAKTHFGSDA